MTPLESWVILGWLRSRSPSDTDHRHRAQVDDATVYRCRTADGSDTMALRVEADGAWSLHTSRCVVWDDGTHRAAGDRHVECDRLCGDAVEALTCYYNDKDMKGIP